MFCQLGNIVFEALTGFGSYDEEEAANIAEYGVIGAKAIPVVASYGLRGVTIGLSLHQRFVIVAVAEAQLTGYMQHGDVVSLVWGNGTVEGQFLIKSLKKTYIEMDGLGNVYQMNISVELIEAPGQQLYSDQQRSAAKGAFASSTAVANPWLLGDPRFKRPVPGLTKPWVSFAQLLQVIADGASIIDALAYGGGFPSIPGGLGGVLAGMTVSVGALLANYTSYGSSYDLPDQTSYINAVSGALATLSGDYGSSDWVSFQMDNVAFQAAMVALST